VRNAHSPAIHAGGQASTGQQKNAYGHGGLLAETILAGQSFNRAACGEERTKDIVGVGVSRRLAKRGALRKRRRA
jgi:hypothetical protein